MKTTSNDPRQTTLQAMGLLTGAVAHDFNNILSIIQGYAYILDHNFGSNPLIHEKLEAIFIATRRGAELTDSLLELNKSHSTKIDNRCELTGLLEKNHLLLRCLLSSRISLTLQLPSHLVMVASPKHDVMERLIRMAAQLRETIKGTGRVILRIDITTEQACIMLTNELNGQTFQESFPHIRDVSLQDKTVLVVDDEEALLPVLEHHLVNMGLKVLKAANADTALLLQKDYPDVIDFLLTDIVMPDVDGVQLAELMTDNRPRMGVVYMTGHASQKDGIHIPGGSLIIPKPLDPETISDALKKALEHVQDA